MVSSNISKLNEQNKQNNFQLYEIVFLSFRSIDLIQNQVIYFRNNPSIQLALYPFSDLPILVTPQFSSFPFSTDEQDFVDIDTSLSINFRLIRCSHAITINPKVMSV